MNVGNKIGWLTFGVGLGALLLSLWQFSTAPSVELQAEVRSWAVHIPEQIKIIPDKIGDDVRSFESLHNDYKANMRDAIFKKLLDKGVESAEAINFINNLPTHPDTLPETKEAMKAMRSILSECRSVAVVNLINYGDQKAQNIQLFLDNVGYVQVIREGDSSNEYSVEENSIIIESLSKNQAATLICWGIFSPSFIHRELKISHDSGEANVAFLFEAGSLGNFISENPKFVLFIVLVVLILLCIYCIPYILSLKSRIKELEKKAA